MEQAYCSVAIVTGTEAAGSGWGMGEVGLKLVLTGGMNGDQELMHDVFVLMVREQGGVAGVGGRWKRLRAALGGGTWLDLAPSRWMHLSAVLNG